MVRSELILLVLLFCIGCNRSVTLEEDASDGYINYKNNTLYPFEMDSVFVTIRPDKLNIKDFIVKAEKEPLGEKFTHYIDIKYYSRLGIDSSQINYKGMNYYACGKLNLNHGVTGYLVLKKKPNEMSSSDWFYNLILLNVKNNHLKSMIVVSQNGLHFPENIVRKTYINYSDYLFLITDVSLFEGIDGSDFHIDDFWSKLGILKPKGVKYFYSSFTLDENGFVKSIPLDEDKFP